MGDAKANGPYRGQSGLVLRWILRHAGATFPGGPWRRGSRDDITFALRRTPRTAWPASPFQRNPLCHAARDAVIFLQPSSSLQLCGNGESALARIAVAAANRPGLTPTPNRGRPAGQASRGRPRPLLRDRFQCVASAAMSFTINGNNEMQSLRPRAPAAPTLSAHTATRSIPS